MLAAGAATTAAVVFVVAGIDLALADGKAPATASPRPSASTAEPRSPAPPSTLAADGQSGIRGTAAEVDAATSARSRQPVVVPERASGRFDVAAGHSAQVGTGHLVTYAVEVERGLPLKLREVTRSVDAVLGSPKGWTATGAASLQRVPAAPDIRILVASPETTDRLCSPLDTGGRLSCRNGDLVVLNAWRWVNGADTYAGDGRAYRQYMINHEVGHALGNAHAACTKHGELAPVMVQQTKDLDGCLPNPWPTIAQ